ncbi:MAG: ABC transporter ATP-binding protein/permease [Melioribacteraceae bacterium]|nr:ABC transporter ATP-binding protein/permease [Melioribacteraceae bacterium]MCF8263313.1 ABC transporter ATP-binding protein/permease [Melioribacteraceae bacterium]MCF8413555.1 ABC transporter ATP-binding protein/permease [Melioribacteraceae bacterium]
MTGLKSLNKYFFRYRKKLIAGIIFILLSNGFQVYVPLLLRDGIDSLKSTVDYDQILNYALLIMGASVLSGIFRFLIRQTIIVVSREIEFDIRQDFWTHIQRLPLRFFQNNSTGNVMAHATNDVGAVRMFVGPAVMYSIDTITKFIIIIFIISSISWELTVYAILPLPVLSYFIYRLSKKIHHKFTLIQEKFSELTTRAQENFSGIRIIKSYVREQSEIANFMKLSQDYLERNMDKVKIQAFFMPILFLITGLSIIIVIWLGGNKVIDGAITLGELTAFIVYIGLLIWPTIAFGWVTNIIQQASASMNRLSKIWNEKYEIEDSVDTDHTISNIKGSIEFKNVSFKYRPDLPNVLNNLNLKIEKGQTIAIIGHTGVGKTSFINLIPRLYDTTEGEILIDGKNVKEIPLHILRKNIGLVPQETFLFSDSLQNNILYGLEDKNKETVQKVARISRLDKDVESFPKGYETILGERGITLSGGQKQRTCLSRALAIDPSILILDDSFSAVDTNTEEEILTNLKEFMRGRTSIIISHRISTVKDADRIFVIDDGIISEEGTHEELVAKEGIYSEIHFRQLLEEELQELT